MVCDTVQKVNQQSLLWLQPTDTSSVTFRRPSPCLHFPHCFQSNIYPHPVTPNSRFSDTTHVEFSAQFPTIYDLPPLSRQLVLVPFTNDMFTLVIRSHRHCREDMGRRGSRFTPAKDSRATGD